METKEDISLEKIYEAIKDLKDSGHKQYMKNRYRSSVVFGAGVAIFGLGLLIASFSKCSQIAIGAGFLVGGLLTLLIAGKLLVQAQRKDKQKEES